MSPPLANGAAQEIISRCRACGEACREYVTWCRSEGAEPASFDALRCIALLAMIADRLEAEGDCPTDVVDATIELARELPDDHSGCTAACRAAADALSDWLDSSYEHP